MLFIGNFVTKICRTKNLHPRVRKTSRQFGSAVMFRPPADPKGLPFDTFSEIHFWPTDPKIFLKAPLAPIYTNFEEERAPKKRDFFVKIFQKVPKNGFFDCFFKNLPAAQIILPK